MSEELKLLILNKLDLFFKLKTETSIETHKNKKYFLKMAGKKRFEYVKNEILILEKIRSLSPFYDNYLISSAEKKDKIGMLLRNVHGWNIYEVILDLKHYVKLPENHILNFYSYLLRKLKNLHDNNITHGDIRAENIMFYYKVENKKKKLDCDFIDFEASHDFSQNSKYSKYSKYLNLYSHNYNFPEDLKTVRHDILKNKIKKKQAFLFYKFLDIFSVSIIILFIYKRSLFDLSTRWNLTNRHPKNYVTENNLLERLLYYVFDFVKYPLVLTEKNIPNLSTIINIIDSQN